MDGSAIVTGRAPARVSLVGGGTDLPAYYERYGGAVVSFAIDLYSSAEIVPRPDGLELVSADADARELIASHTLARRMRPPILAEDFLLYQKAVAAMYGLDGARVTVSSDVPVGAGLASSGSVCVALVAAAARFAGDQPTVSEIAEVAFRVEHDLLRRPVGKQDQYASAYGGLNLIEFGNDGSVGVTPLDLASSTEATLQQRILLFGNGSRRSASVPLSEQERRTIGDQETIRALGALKRMAYEMRDLLAGGEVDAVGELMHRAWEAKQHLSSQVSTPEIARVYALARRAGATGGKLAGAGTAGTLVLYCPQDTHDDVRRMMASQGWRERPAAIDRSGAIVTEETSDDLVGT